MSANEKNSGARITRVANQTNEVVSLVLHEDFLRVYFGDPLASYADYHYFWLRLNHPPEDFRHLEKIMTPSELPIPNIRPLTVTLTDDCGAIELVWSDIQSLKQSTITLEWLMNNAYALNRTELESLAPLTPGLDQAYCFNQEDFAARCVENALTTGFAQGLDFSGDTQDLLNLFEKQSLIATTRGQKIKGPTAPLANAYTSLQHPPSLILIHCAENQDFECCYRFVNCRSMAEQLFHKDFFAFSALAEQGVQFTETKQKDTHTRHAPLIELDHNVVTRVNYSLEALQPSRIAFSHLPHWYHSLRQFQRTLNSDEESSHLNLRHGDFILLNPAWYAFGVVQQDPGVRVYEVPLMRAEINS